MNDFINKLSRNWERQGGFNGLFGAIGQDLSSLGNAVKKTVSLPGKVLHQGYNPTLQEVMGFSGMVGGGSLLAKRPSGSLGMGGNIAAQKGSGTTQVATTVGSYGKAAKILDIKKSDDVLDYGAGLGLGSDVMRKSKANVESLEVNPERWKSKVPPTYTNSSHIDKQFDKVVSLNVLNVLEPELRDMVFKDIVAKVKPGGSAIIGARSFKGDVAQAKNFTKADEPGALWIHKKEGPVYQKGFDGNELVEYALDRLPAGYSVVKQTGVGSKGIKITRDW